MALLLRDISYLARDADRIEQNCDVIKVVVHFVLRMPDIELLYQHLASPEREERKFSSTLAAATE
ncbi:MAG: hypothetical protein MUP44_07805 [Anaerolineales bacterium]|nr:hypothetical protein [Anaerolineales bacterium]